MTDFIPAELDMYWDFITARQAITEKRKQKLLWPWTDDAVLSKYSMTNMYRRLDPGTQYAVQHIENGWHLSTATRLFNLLLYRCLGRQSTFEHVVSRMNNSLVYPYNLSERKSYRDQLTNALLEYRDVLKKPVFSTAYMVPAFDWQPGPTKVEKIVAQWADWACGWPATYDHCNDAEDGLSFYSELKSLQGVGRFLASQVYVDCTYNLPDSNHNMMYWPVELYNDFMVPGPGALTGLQRLTGLTSPPNDELALELMIALRDMQESELTPRDFAWSTEKDLGVSDDEETECTLSVQDIQNTLCEFGKYRKIQQGTGKARRKYCYALPDASKALALSLAVSPVIELTWANSTEDNKRLYFAAHDGEDVAARVAEASGYECAQWSKDDRTGLTSNVLVVPMPDTSKYDLADGVNDPIAELSHHLCYGLGEEVQPELHVRQLD